MVFSLPCFQRSGRDIISAHRRLWAASPETSDFRPKIPGPVSKWSWTGSNRRPPACKADALPAELQPHAPSGHVAHPRSAPAVGLGRFELPTSRLSGVRSNQLSYRPRIPRSSLDNRSKARSSKTGQQMRRRARPRVYVRKKRTILLRKEVIQPQVPLRLPCYDFTPVTNHSLGACLPKVSSTTSGVVNFHGVTGGVYKARERIHRGMLIRDY